MDIRPTAPSAAPATPAAHADKAAPAVTAAPAASADALRHAEPTPTEEQLSQALKNINSVLQSRSQDVEFSIDQDSARTIVTVTDKTTHEVIRQMPTKEAMEISKALEHLQSLLIKQTA
jgi:flagellar protein FlaG